MRENVEKFSLMLSVAVSAARSKHGFVNCKVVERFPESFLARDLTDQACHRVLIHAVSKENARKFLRMSSLPSSADISSVGFSRCQTTSPCTDIPTFQWACRRPAG